MPDYAKGPEEPQSFSSIREGILTRWLDQEALPHEWISGLKWDGCKREFDS
jgi:hypothetical protein